MEGLKDAKAAERYSKNIEKYLHDEKEVQAKAIEFEKESGGNKTKAHRLHYSEVFLEIGIVFASLAILTKRRPLWWTSFLCGAVGILGALTILIVI